MDGILQLRIVTPQRLVLDETTTSVTAEGALGQFGVLPQHITFLTALEPGILTAKTVGGGERRIAVRGGFAEVKNDVMTVLADEAVVESEIDAGRAGAAIETAEHALAEAPFGHPEHEERERERRWAEVLAALAARN